MTKEERIKNLTENPEYTRDFLITAFAEKMEKTEKDYEWISRMIDAMLNAPSESDMKRHYYGIKRVLDGYSATFADDWKGSMRELYLPEELDKLREDGLYMYIDNGESQMVKHIKGTFYKTEGYGERITEVLCEAKDIVGAKIRGCSGMDF